MRETLIVGSSGFVGSAIRQRVGSRSREYVFASRDDRRNEGPVGRTTRIDLLDETQVSAVSNFDHAVWVAGSADHRLGWVNPIADLESQVVALLRFLQHFRGSLTLLSSQATYYGLRGEIEEDVDHVPTMPYGLAKLAAESYARWALGAGRLRTLWIFRLMYAYGAGEASHRLLARCVRSRRDGKRVAIAGGGRSFLNPLPVEFVADVLLRSSDQMTTEPDGFSEVTNINHPERWTVRDVVEAFGRLHNFDHEVVESGEDWPVTFYGSVDRLTRWLSRWGLTFPDVEVGLAAYGSRDVRPLSS